ncbi:MAG: hypothetical protein JO170_10010 [Verrucomicrobia bacterium]|nr:hypothetical protein [Verrucomicrobiota bacterium]
MASEDSHRSDSAEEDEEQGDPRVAIIGRIWRMLIPVVALSIPFVLLSHLGIVLPFFAIGAAGLATACVWYFGGKREGAGRKENERLQQRIKELEERLANVETISRFEMQLAAREKAALEDSHAQSTSQQPQSEAKKESA